MARVSARRNWLELAKAANYNARELAKLCRFSLRQLQRIFKGDVGQSPKKWLDKQRLDAAQDLLLNGQSVKSVAYDMGYKQSSHFCRRFKARSKMTPSQFVILTEH